VAKKQFRNPRANRPPIAFDLVYDLPVRVKVNVAGPEEDPRWEFQKTGDWEEKTEEFHADPNIRGGLLVDITPPDPDDQKAVVRFGAAIREALTSVVVEPEQDRFQELLDDEDAVIQMSLLSDILNWVIEEAGKGQPAG
jgi:hypothetical protein